MYLPICSPNNFTLDHCETLEWPVSRSVIWQLLTQDVLGRCKKRYELLFIMQKDNYILHIIRFLGILSSAWNMVRENKKMIIPWMKTQLTKERKLILAQVSKYTRMLGVTLVAITRTSNSYFMFSYRSVQMGWDTNISNSGGRKWQHVVHQIWVQKFITATANYRKLKLRLFRNYAKELLAF